MNWFLKNLKNLINEDHIFSKSDITCGVETELQTCVIGNKNNVDLPIYIMNSKYYNNLLKRTKNGEYSYKRLELLENYINENKENVWENSYVFFDSSTISDYANSIIQYDFLSDKSSPNSSLRKDVSLYIIKKNGKKYYRFPISYFLKVALADFLGNDKNLNTYSKELIKKLLNNFSNDNTSPEITSFYVVKDSKDFGDLISRENCKRFLFTQLLCLYGNKKFNLKDFGQRVLIYHAPLTPIRQRYLNEIIPDSLYRELFMSPCLSGWDKGEEKKHYMELCHLSLSRSYLNTISKLKDAGIIRNNLIVLPNTSNTCLTNNGIHISIGSKMLTSKIKENPSYHHIEKYFSDLVVKVVEHFIPLITANYSASPYRLSFRDLHPEKMLGFLPHELDFTHLRMIYRRWMKKVKNKFFWTRITPFGPEFIDSIIEKLFMLKGDFIPDYRLIDFFIAPLSTDSSPAFNGKVGNQKRLKLELKESGIFDDRLSFYAIFRGRLVKEYGFHGFEGRFYSCFYDLYNDMKHSVNLQALFIYIAYNLILNGEITHNDIPDDPFVESERRQIFFANAIGIPTVYIHKQSKNNFLMKILSYTKSSRSSRRYPSYIRVEIEDYLKALYSLIVKEYLHIVNDLDIKESLCDLKTRLEDISKRTSQKLIAKILSDFRVKSPLDIEADKFNKNMEIFYREDLRIKHIKEGFKILLEELTEVNNYAPYLNKTSILNNIINFIENIQESVIKETITLDELEKLLCIMSLNFCYEIEKYGDKDKCLNIAL